jgi:hypothetical protein
VVWILCLSAVLCAIAPSVARAQQRVEVGTTLINATFLANDDKATLIGVPSGAFELINPALYASFFVGKRVSVEPQVALMVLSENDETNYFLNTAVQANWYLRESTGSAPYVFASAGFINFTDAEYTPKTFSAGVGYRMRLGDRLVFKLDGRYVRMTADFGSDFDLVVVSLWLGGLFGK